MQLPDHHRPVQWDCFEFVPDDGISRDTRPRFRVCPFGLWNKANGIISFETPGRPNAWVRFWQWFLFGWVWEPVKNLHSGSALRLQ